MERVGIISVDGHVTGSRQAFRQYVDKKYLEANDAWAKSMDEMGLEFLGNLKPEYDPASQWDSELRLKELEAQGVVAEVLFPNGMPFQMVPFVDVGSASDPALSRQAVEVYNRWLADFCAAAPGRRAGQAGSSFGDVDRAVRDVCWAKEHGLGGLMMPPL